MNCPHKKESLSMCKRVALGIFLVLMVALGAALPLYAADVSGALFTLTTRWTNTGASDQNDIQVSFAISGESLIDQNLIASDALNAALQKGGVDQPGMPPTTRIDIEGVVTQDGDAFTERTAAAQNATLNDVPLLPVTPAVDDAFYFGCDNPCRILTLDTDTAGVNTLTLTWEYWDGDSYEALSGVTDNTTTFTSLGRDTVSWDMPTNWGTQTVTGSAVNSYWGRARVTAFTSQATQPLGSRVFYENGEWWTWLENIATGNQEQYTLSFGGADMVTSHQMFPGAAGIIAADNATIEPGANYSLGYQGRLNFATSGTNVCLACKTAAFTLHVTGTASTPGLFSTITGSGTTVLELSGMSLPNTGAQNVTMGGSGTDVALFSDAGGGLSLRGGQTVTNNANSWTFASNGSTDYFEFIRLYTGKPTVFNLDNTAIRWATGTHTNTRAYSGRIGLDNE